MPFWTDARTEPLAWSLHSFTKQFDSPAAQTAGLRPPWANRVTGLHDLMKCWWCGASRMARSRRP